MSKKMSSAARLAGNVCATCRSRKKGCDKFMPTCGYCQHRGLACSYDWNDDAIMHRESRSPSKTSTSASLTPPRPLLSIPSTSGGRPPETLDQVLHLYVCDVPNLLGMNLHDALVCYFSGPHMWLPVVHPGRVFKGVAEIGGRSAPPSADFSIMLLAICLLGVPTSQSISKAGPEDSLYISVKTLFGHVQVVRCVSPTLVQAALLISAFEFATGRQDAAAISIGACARMACVLDMESNPALTDNTAPYTESTLEEINMWWGVVVFERIILSLFPHRLYRPVTDIPPQGAQLPSDLTYNPTSPSPVVSNSQDNCSFALQAQAVRLLDQVFVFMKSQAMVPDLIHEIKELDACLWRFLAVIIDVFGRNQSLSPSPIATTMRAIYLLHQHTLFLIDILPSEDTFTVAQKAQSHAAIQSAIRILGDASISHNVYRHGKRSPLCARYNVRGATEYMDNYPSCMPEEDKEIYKKAIAQLETATFARWGPARPALPQIRLPGWDRAVSMSL